MVAPRWITVALLSTLLWAPLGASAKPGQERFAFALIGDSPYGAAEVEKFERLVDDVNAPTGVRFVIHVGDIRGSQDSPCSDAVLRARRDLFQQFRAPFVLSPGDNEWFDCQGAAGGGFDPIERLGFLRALFYPQPDRTIGGRSMAVRAQSNDPDFAEVVENVMWTHGGVVFATLHVVAVDFPPSPPVAAQAERLVDAAVAWIEEAFAEAERTDAPAVVLAMQANPWLATGNALAFRFICPACLAPRGGLGRITPALEEAVIRFGKPVLLAVGDTHVFRVDRPLRSSITELAVENFTRVETFGHPFVQWIRVSVDPRRRGVFSFEPHVIEANVIPAPLP